MFHLYRAKPSSSDDVNLISEPFNSDEWSRIRSVARDLLDRRHETTAATMLLELPFRLYKASNGFADDFFVLHASLPPGSYVDLVPRAAEPERSASIRSLADVVQKATGCYVRFVSIDPHGSAAVPNVRTPRLRTTSETITHALDDAEALLHARGPRSAVDRVHTALHGHLRLVAELGGLDVRQDASLMDLFGVLRQQHPRLVPTGPRVAEIDQILRALARIIEALNGLRNEATPAHPNPLLGNHEALLAIHAARALLAYLDAKLS